MTLQAIGELLPYAVGVALSPVPIIAVVLMLGTPRARANGPAFAAGWLLGLIVVSLVVLLVANGADDPDSGTSAGVNWAQVVVGLAFFAFALRQWRHRPREGQEPRLPGWMKTLDRFGAGRAFVLGIGLSAVNPKNLALSAAAAASIAQAGLSAGGTTLAVTVFVVLASVTVAGPVVVYLLAGTRASRALGSLKDLMAAHNAVIMMVLFVVLGAKILGAGLGGFSS